MDLLRMHIRAALPALFYRQQPNGADKFSTIKTSAMCLIDISFDNLMRGPESRAAQCLTESTVASNILQAGAESAPHSSDGDQEARRAREASEHWDRRRGRCPRYGQPGDQQALYSDEVAFADNELDSDSDGENEDFVRYAVPRLLDIQERREFARRQQHDELREQGRHHARELAENWNHQGALARAYGDEDDDDPQGMRSTTVDLSSFRIDGQAEGLALRMTPEWLSAARRVLYDYTNQHKDTIRDPGKFKKGR
ncbi:hypothetical protein Slin15195_G045380 [Septoria linicola]|uniref:Uncharacterized protein n=1 Tax=Septoria linicola TaxID=215465 RepID=A0A9Q9AN76_9PEZI|nr:hypothetical protein Slin14017_G048900 [Septoria linicola]USW51219.1 hypothetical protein Slin15195_G045380 [Septoria linicola]